MIVNAYIRKYVYIPQGAESGKRVWLQRLQLIVVER